jgi:hypothetical protein
MQIEKQAKEFMQGLTNMRTALVVGGMPLPPQVHRIQVYILRCAFTNVASSIMYTISVLC